MAVIEYTLIVIYPLPVLSCSIILLLRFTTFTITMNCICCEKGKDKTIYCLLPKIPGVKVSPSVTSVESSEQFWHKIRQIWRICEPWLVVVVVVDYHIPGNYENNDSWVQTSIRNTCTVQVMLEIMVSFCTNLWSSICNIQVMKGHILNYLFFLVNIAFRKWNILFCF